MEVARRVAHPRAACTLLGGALALLAHLDVLLRTGRQMREDEQRRQLRKAA